jgi:hypothetical protein
MKTMCWIIGVCVLFTAFEVSADTKLLYLRCSAEGSKTTFKIDMTDPDARKVFTSVNGDWVKRTVLQENREHIWLESGWIKTRQNTNRCITTACPYDLQIELISVEPFTVDKPASDLPLRIPLHLIADSACVIIPSWSNDCTKYKAGERFDTIYCNVVYQVK